MRPLICSLLLSLAATASAVPMNFSHQGRLNDQTGVPVDGSGLAVQFTIYDAPSGGVGLWDETVPVDFDNGYFKVELGNGTSLDSATFDGSTVYLAMKVGSGAELPQRLALVSVPYAVRAGIAGDIDPGLVINAAEIQVNGTTVIDSSGQVDSGAMGAATDTLADLGCSIDQIARHDGSAWVCAPDNAHPHAAADVSSGVLDVNRIPVGTGASEVAVGDHGHTAADVGALPSSTTAADIGALPTGTTAADIGALPTGTTAADIGALPTGTTAADIGALADTALTGDVTVGGSLTLGDNTGTCDGSLDGAMRYAAGILEVCNGTEWLRVALLGNNDGSSSANPGVTCKQIHTDFPGAVSGAYWLDVGGTPTQLWCDMTTDGGGWTRMNLFIAGNQAASDWVCNNSDATWARLRTFTQGWGSGGEVMSTAYAANGGAETQVASSKVKFGPGPFGNIYDLFNFAERGSSWEYGASGVFGMSDLTGTGFGNAIWWNHGPNTTKADYCIGTSPNHQACIYTGNGGQCGNVHRTSWLSNNATHEIYVREP